MWKKIMLTSLVIMLLMITGCERKSIDDVYSIVEGESSTYGINTSKSLSALEAYEQGVTESSKYVYNDEGYITWSTDDFPELIPQNTTCTTTISTTSKKTLSFCVKDSVITDNFNALTELTDIDNYTRLKDFLLNVDNNKLIDDNGNVNLSHRGVSSKLIFVKMDITNENDYEKVFYPTNLKIYSIDNNGNQFKYKFVENNDKLCVDKPDNWTIKGARKITLQPWETKEVVIGYFIEDTWVQQYQGRDENIVLGDKVPLDNIYLTTHFIDTGKSSYYREGFEANRSLLKLNLRTSLN